MNQFKSFHLSQALERALQAMGFELPTPIQSQAIPPALSGQDLIATAQTGTGKTAAFGIPIVEFLLKNRQSAALVLAPTRELALQIAAVWKDLTRFTPELNAVCVIGGASFSVQRKGLGRNPRMIIATPGRLVDHLMQKTANLGRIGVLVLDEADRMLDMGFAPQLSRILGHLPRDRQTMLFSATWGTELDGLSKKYMRSPKRIAVGSASQAAKTVAQSVLSTTTQSKNETLLDAINERPGSVLIFARTKSRTDRLTRYLNSYGLEAARIHGGRTQGQRNAALSAFKTGQTRILVATDIAARGLDISEIAHVINYDLPQVAEDYIHRIGRTGRAGSEGQALSLLTNEDRMQWNEISRLLKRTGSAEPRFLKTKTSAPKPSVRESRACPRP